MNLCFFDLVSGEKVSWDSLIESVSKSGVVYVGEIHNNKKIHDLQLSIIESLVKKGFKVAVAFEMFQQPYQKFLDEFVGGKISEVEMLYLTEWHKNWNMDISLYRDIWNFARENKLKMLAINIPTDFRKKVRTMSYERMRKTEYLPPDLEEPDSSYIEYFKKAIGGHEGANDRFNEMLKVMLAWDEGMAYAISKFIKENKNTKVVVIVGYGHIYGRLGIPKRVERMTGERGTVIIPLQNLKDDMGKGDFGFCVE
ncbi:MAG: ChaN family lipoprotein [candidate division WOR-3 bacterium]